jgi:hypothetical protein
MWGGNDVGRGQIFLGPCRNAERFEIREGGKSVPGSRDASGVESATVSKLGFAREIARSSRLIGEGNSHT